MEIVETRNLTMIELQRLRPLNSLSTRRGKYVLYWMQTSQRARCNHALEYAIEQANAMNVPVVTAFGLTNDYPQANQRHYAFMLEGLAETQTALARRGVQLVVHLGDPADIAAAMAADAAMVVADRGYLRHQKRWRRQLARKARCQAVMVESDVVVPVDAASTKQEYAARTIRPKLHRLWKQFTIPLRQKRPRRDSLGLRLDGEDISNIHALLKRLRIDASVTPTKYFTGGLRRARKLLAKFIDGPLGDYGTRRNDPSLDIQSHMSPYLHFGQISPLEIALAITKSNASQECIDVYLEEILVRRELCINFVEYCQNYDSYQAVPGWARATLRHHQRDKRPYLYTPEQIATSATHDPYFNAAMTEMRLTGKMHNYMRMYWGKKIIEWSTTPAKAHRTILSLNNRYFLDGRDPLSYANVAWLFGLHDRPWQNRPIFGSVRYMNAPGLERKFNIDEYVKQVSMLE